MRSPGLNTVLQLPIIFVNVKINLVMFDTDLITFNLCDVKFRLRPLDHKLVLVDGAGEDLWWVGCAGNEHLNLLYRWRHHVRVETRLHRHVVDAPGDE